MILVIPLAAQRAILDHRRTGKPIDRWWMFAIRDANGIHEHASRWRGWRSTIWGR